MPSSEVEMRRLGLASPGHAIMPWRGDPVSTLRRFDRHPLQLHCHGHALCPWIDPDPVEGVAAVAEGSPRPRFTLVELHEAGFLYHRSRHHHPTASRRAGDQARRPRHLVRSVVLDLALDVTVDPSRAEISAPHLRRHEASTGGKSCGFNDLEVRGILQIETTEASIRRKVFDFILLRE